MKKTFNVRLEKKRIGLGPSCPPLLNSGGSDKPKSSVGSVSNNCEIKLNESFMSGFLSSYAV